MAQEFSWIYISENDPDTVFDALQKQEGGRLIGQCGEWLQGEALLTRLQPDIALLDLGTGEEGLDYLARWSALFPRIRFFCTAGQARPELIVRAMRCGAGEFLLPDADDEEISRALKSVRPGVDSGRDRPARARTVCCFGVKGGMGTTTLAVNLAVAAAKNNGRRVLLIDSKLQLGNAALFLDIKPRISLLELLENLATLEVSRLDAILPGHGSGLHFIAGPESMEEAEKITAAGLGRLLELLRPEYDLIIIDCDDHFDEVTIRVLDEADLILTIAQLDLSTVYNLKRTLALFRRMGYAEEKIAVVLNRYPQRISDELQSIEGSIGRSVCCRLPLQENGALLESINVGEPIILSRPRHPFSLQMAELLNHIQAEGRAKNTAAPRNSRGLLRRLTGRKE
ncbi:MAG TPA: AAA family ATPase [bacterium]|nr:AAA family ATPase [bacterium]HPG84071.1 AAA family ATPase [bacterium]